MAATAALCGSGGTVTGADSATEIVSWSIEQTIDAVDATSLSSNGWKERVACLRGASGSFKCIGTHADVGPTTGTFKTAASGGYSIAGNIVISKVTANVDVNDAVSFDHQFVFTGTITIA
jgi:hypothetical protein